MAVSDSYRLQPGTILDDRYLIQDVIGEGGFGITYRALHKRVNRQVAIKEFFIRDQNYRDTSVSTVLQITREENRGYFEREKENFVREARILGEFSGERHMVSVLDYFEGNGTAYMVMEMLEGETLKKYLELHGTMRPEEAFARFLPVMELLEKLHQRNMIHRDISPENLMLMQDGTLRLLDFGAARDYDPNLENTYSVIVKKGYAPPEQYRKGARQGPWTDIYALTAAIYTCIVGQAPQDALSRILHDEMRMPSELGIPAVREAEDILERGMRLDWEQRYVSMEEMRLAVAAFLDRIVCGEEEIHRRKRKKRKTPWIILAACVCVLAAVSGYVFFSDKKIQMFRGVETETLLVEASDDMTLRELPQVREILTRRLELLAGDSHVLMEDREDGTIRVTVPQQAFGDREIDQTLEQYIMCSMDLQVNSADESPTEPGRKLMPEDFADVQVCDGVFPRKKEADPPWFLRITLTGDAGAELEAMANENGELTLYHGERMEYYYSLLTAGDGHTFYLLGEGEKEPYAKLLAYNLSSPRYEGSLRYTYDILAAWEEPVRIAAAGAFQCTRKELKGETFCARYGDGMTEEWSEDFSGGERADIISNLKKRLDAVGVPYAFGISGADEDDFVIAVERDRLCLEIMQLLGCSPGEISIGNQWENDLLFSYRISEMDLREEEGSFEVIVEEDEWDNLEKELEASRKEGLVTWYLYLNGRPLAMCDLRQDAKDGRLIFRRLCSYHEPEISEENSGILRLVEAIWETDGYFYGCIQEASQYSDASGELQLPGSLDEEKYSLLLLQDRLEEIRHKAEELEPGIKVIIDWEWDSPQLYMVIPMEFDKDFARNYMELFQRVYEACELGRGDFAGAVVRWEGERGELGERARMLLTQRPKKRQMACKGLFYGGRMEACKKEIETYVSDSIFYQGLASKDREWLFEP